MKSNAFVIPSRFKDFGRHFPSAGRTSGNMCLSRTLSVWQLFWLCIRATHGRQSISLEVKTFFFFFFCLSYSLQIFFLSFFLSQPRFSGLCETVRLCVCVCASKRLCMRAFAEMHPWNFVATEVEQPNLSNTPTWWRPRKLQRLQAFSKGMHGDGPE